MIRPININLNAAHPELPLVEATTFVGAPSSVFIRGVPKAVGNWSITAVSVAVTYPDNTTTARAAVESAEGVWVATIPGTATSGRTAAGFKIMADGIDENGAAVTGYVLGFADFSVLSFTPVPAPGGTFYFLRYFDQVPATPKEGDVAVVDGLLKMYNGTAWEPFAAPVTLDDAVTRTSANGVKSSGIWSAIWGALSALPTGFTSLYDWCVAQLAPKVARTELFPAWAANTAYTTYSLVIHGDAVYKCTTAHTSGAEWDSTKWGVATGADVLGVLLNYLALSNKPQINGHTLTGDGSQSGASLGILDLSGGTVSGMLSSKNTNDANAIVGFLGSDIVHRANFNGELSPIFRIKWPINHGTLALLQNLASDFSTSATYALDALCVYEKKLYRCTNAVTTAGDWTGSTNWTEATVEDVLAALRAAIAGKADVSAIPYSLVAKIIDNGAVTLDDRAINAVAVSSSLASLTVNFPTATSGKVRDFGLRLTVASGITTAPQLVLPQGVVCENADGEAPEIGADGAATILYFTETASGVFLVKGEVVTAIS